jgi:hypothetical protein
LTRRARRLVYLGKPEYEAAALTWQALRSDRAAKNDRDPLDNRQAEADPGLTSAACFC